MTSWSLRRSHCTPTGGIRDSWASELVFHGDLGLLAIGDDVKVLIMSPTGDIGIGHSSPFISIFVSLEAHGSGWGQSAE